MAMFPVFIIGVIVGIICAILWNVFKQDAPSETRLHILEATILGLRDDIAMLEKTNKELNEKLKKSKIK